jgi:hypothetical protein
LISTLLFAAVIPLQAHFAEHSLRLCTYPWLVAAIVDSARIVGLPRFKSRKLFTKQGRTDGDPMVETMLQGNEKPGGPASIANERYQFIAQYLNVQRGR